MEDSLTVERSLAEEESSAEEEFSVEDRDLDNSSLSVEKKNDNVLLVMRSIDENERNIGNTYLF